MEVPFWIICLVAILFIGGIVLLSMLVEYTEKKKTSAVGNPPSDKN
jgi:hypothetical protein